MKTILCNKCHKSVEVSDVWSFKQCPSCLGKQREKEAEVKMNKPSSFNPESTSNPFLSFEEDRHHFPKSTFQQFLEAKVQFEETPRLFSNGFASKNCNRGNRQTLETLINEEACYLPSF